MPAVELKEEAEIEVAPTPQPASNKLVLDIDVSAATISDMQAIDRIVSGEPGAFAAGVDTLARFVTNLDIRQRPRKEFRAIARAVMDQFKEESQGN